MTCGFYEHGDCRKHCISITFEEDIKPFLETVKTTLAKAKDRLEEITEQVSEVLSERDEDVTLKSDRFMAIVGAAQSFLGKSLLGGDQLEQLKFPKNTEPRCGNLSPVYAAHKSRLS